MTNEWEERAANAAGTRRAFWIWTPIFCGVGGLGLIGAWLAGGVFGWAIGLCSGALALWGFVYGTLVYMRAIDEQERDANLWGCYAGMCAYLPLFAAHYAAQAMGYVVPYAETAIFLIVMLVVLGVFVWRRFR